MARSSFIPGFRFHPTDSELVMYYLKRKVLGKKIIVDAVTEVNIYEYTPWDLRDKSAIKNGDLEWFFFCPKSKKYNSGSRYNRATEIGFWKATGKDRNVTYRGRTVATIKTLVFHIGHAGKGERTDWVMHEYRLEDEQLANAGVVQDTYVLIKLFEKAGSGPKNGAQYGAPFNEEEWEDDYIASCSNALATVGPLEATTTNPSSYKQKGPATVNMYEPGSSAVTCSANETTGNTNPLGYKQKGPATVNMYEPGSSAVTCSANETTGKIAHYKQKSTAPMEMMVAPQITHNLCLTEPESSIVTLSANERRGDVPVGDSIVTLSANERRGDVPVGDDDMMSLEDIAFLLGVSEDNTNEVVEVENVEKNDIMAPNADDGIYNELVNLINLDEFNGGASASGSEPAVYMFDKPLDDLDFNLGAFYVD